MNTFSNILKDRVLIVAELSANHNGNLQVALDTIRAAARAGADAIKIQTYTPDTMTIESDKDDFILKSDSIWDGKTFYELYKEAYTPWEWHKEIFNLAAEEGLICFSTPFDKTSVDFLESLNNPVYKIASFEITDIPLIEYAASKMKPLIISTGIATEEDIQLALHTCYKAGNHDVTLLKCTSSYPAPLDEANLIMIKQLAEKLNVRTGLSDHTIGNIAPIMAVCFGAKIIEKHFIIDRSIGGPDSSFSMNELEFAEMVKAVRSTEKAIGEITYTLTPKQQKSRDFSRSLYVVQNIVEGDVITNENVKAIRPGFGLHPKYFKDVLGKKVNRNIEKGSRLELSDVIN